MQTSRSVRGTATGITKDLLLKELALVKWFLWHGNVVRADDTLSSLIEVDGVREDDREAGRRSQLVLKYMWYWNRYPISPGHERLATDCSELHSSIARDAPGKVCDELLCGMKTFLAA